MSGRGLTRARLVGAALAFAGSLGAAQLRPWRPLVEVERRGPAARLAGLLGSGESVRAIAAEYVLARPDEAHADLLLAEISRSLPDGARTLAASGAELRGLLAERVAADFVEGKTVTLDGWILSETEARLCALAVLA